MKNKALELNLFGFLNVNHEQSFSEQCLVFWGFLGVYTEKCSSAPNTPSTGKLCFLGVLLFPFHNSLGCFFYFLCQLLVKMTFC